ncbi:hypothetical protein [Actinosynnema sp. ALI-1.44]|uniref:hypothetical protein n=1 Tax=Actinosynnema sp. ALI-1.44 TaxID=1933779 RepID=UPI00143D1644|nr:hypothetical protein [Actinosynnema sp. ALI-1.44]
MTANIPEDDPDTPAGRAAMLQRAETGIADSKMALGAWEQTAANIRQMQQEAGDNE